MNAPVRLPAEARSALRRALKQHDGWRAYQSENRADLASMTKDELLAASAALGIDLATITGTAAEQENSEMNYQPKPKTVGPNEISEIERRYMDAFQNIPTEEREKGGAILKTISEKQAGWATEKQADALRRIIAKAEGSTYTPPAAPPVVTTYEQPPRAPVSADPATQLGALIAQLAGASINPETVARIVDERITAALSAIPTVRVECASPRAVTMSEGRHHPRFIDLLKACSARQPDGFAPNVWVSGPTGSGKTHAAREVANALALPFHSHGAMEMAHELMGWKDAGGTYHRTPFRDAFEHGGIALLDEVDSYAPGVTLALNSALANGGTTFPDGFVKRHADCIIIAAGNTWGGGATAEFVGRNKLDAAFLSRFPVRLSWDYDNELEQHICGNPAWAFKVQSIRAKARSAGLKVVIDPRQSIAGAALIAAGFSEREAAGMTYLANLTADQRKIVEG